MKEEIKTGIIIFIIVATVWSSIFYFGVWKPFENEFCQEGTVTDKYILPNFRGNPEYHIVLNNEKDVMTNENYIMNII